MNSAAHYQGEEMRVTCPSCGYETTISQEVIPEAGKSVTCPECKGRFDVFRPKQAGARRGGA